MLDYRAEIAETSIENLTKRDVLKYTDTSKAIGLDKILAGGEVLTVSPIAYCVLDVHNEKAKDDKDYNQYLIITKDEMYVTGSKSFWNSFKHIFDTMQGEEYDIDIYRMESKNYAGKYFITCSIV